MTMKTIVIIIIILITKLFIVTPVSANEIITLNTGIREPFTNSKRSGFVDLLVQEIFRRIDIDAKVIVYQNAAKALANANLGIDDGAALRIKGLEKKFPNLIRVPEKIMDNDFVAYSIIKPIVTDRMSVLDEARIAYINGWQIFQNNLSGHNFTTRTKTALQMFDLLTAGKVDFILYERWQGLWHARQLGLTIQVSEPPLAKREMFMYLNNKHSGLVKKTSTALLEMKTDGTYQKIFDRTLGQLHQ